MMDGGLHIGEVLGARYRIDELIGQGGMGVVARATDLSTRSLVAVKALRPEVRGHREVLERFYREARAAARIGGEHAVQILDVGRTSEGDPFMVMELLVGEDLDRVLRREGKLRADLAASLLTQACRGVAAAHRGRIVHRDLKPSNLFLARQSSGQTVLKVLDFGISRLDDQASQLTRTSTQLGTPHYMSPEQIERPKSVDHRTDVWALGCIFHKLLVGETPFRGQGVQIISAVLRNKRKKPSEVLPTLPTVVDAIVDKCLEPDLQRRYQSADELAEALAALTATLKTSPSESASTSRINVPAIAESNSKSERPPSSIRTDAGVSVRSLPATTPVPESEADARTTVTGELEHTVALDHQRAPAAMLLQTQPITSQRGAPPAPKSGPLPGTPPPDRSSLVHGLAIAPERTSQTPDSAASRASHTPHATTYTPHTASSAPLAGSDAPRRASLPPTRGASVRRPARRRSSRLLFVGAPLALMAVATVAVLVLPRVAATRAASAASAAGVTLRYAEPRASLHGVTLRDVDATLASVPGVTLHAASAHFSLAMTEVELDDVDLELGDSTNAAANVLRELERASPCRIEARNVHFGYGAPPLRVDGRGARFVVSRNEPPAETSPREQVDLVHLEVEAKEAHIVALGVSFGAVSGHLEGTTAQGTYTAQVPPDGAALVMLRGAYDATGTYASIHAPRQVPPPLLQLSLSTIDAESAPPREMELGMDLRWASGALKGELDLSVFGIAAGAGPALDFSSHMAFHAEAARLDVDSGKARLGPFSLTPMGALTLSQATVMFDSGQISCEEILRARATNGAGPASVSMADLGAYPGVVDKTANAHVALEMGAVLTSPPRVSLALRDAATCGLPVFARAK